MVAIQASEAADILQAAASSSPAIAVVGLIVLALLIFIAVGLRYVFSFLERVSERVSSALDGVRIATATHTQAIDRLTAYLKGSNHGG